MQNLYHKGVGTYLDRVGIGDPCFLENCNSRPTSRPPCEFPTPLGVPGVPPQRYVNLGRLTAWLGSALRGTDESKLCQFQSAASAEPGGRL